LLPLGLKRALSSAFVSLLRDSSRRTPLYLFRITIILTASLASKGIAATKTERRAEV